MINDSCEESGSFCEIHRLHICCVPMCLTDADGKMYEQGGIKRYGIGRAIGNLKDGKTKPSKDGITSEIFKYGGKTVVY